MLMMATSYGSDPLHSYLNSRPQVDYEVRMALLDGWERAAVELSKRYPVFGKTGAIAMWRSYGDMKAADDFVRFCGSICCSLHDFDAALRASGNELAARKLGYLPPPAPPKRSAWLTYRGQWVDWFSYPDRRQAAINLWNSQQSNQLDIYFLGGESFVNWFEGRLGDRLRLITAMREAGIVVPSGVAMRELHDEACVLLDLPLAPARDLAWTKEPAAECGPGIRSDAVPPPPAPRRIVVTQLPAPAKQDDFHAAKVKEQERLLASIPASLPKPPAAATKGPPPPPVPADEKALCIVCDERKRTHAFVHLATAARPKGQLCLLVCEKCADGDFHGLCPTCRTGYDSIMPQFHPE